MFNPTLKANRLTLKFALVVISFAAAAHAAAQTQDPAERQRAIDTYESQKLVAALPLLEKVALAYPNDPVVLSRLGFTFYANSTDEKDVTKRAQMRQRALATLRKSRSLRDQRNLTSMAHEALARPDRRQGPISH